MDILKKLKMINEKTEAPGAIIDWVVEYIKMHHEGDKGHAKIMRRNIEKECKELGINDEKVINYFGDPKSSKAYKKASSWKFQNMVEI